MKFSHLLEQSAAQDPQLREVFTFYKQLKKQLKKFVASELAAQQHCDAVSGLNNDPQAAAVLVEEDTTSGETEAHANAQDRDAMGPDTQTDTGCTTFRDKHLLAAAAVSAAHATKTCARGGLQAAASLNAQQISQEASEARAVLQEQLNDSVSAFRERCKLREEAAVLKLQDLQQQSQLALTSGVLPQQQQVYKQLVELHGELLLLLHWGMMVYTALGKILKKQRKLLQGDAPVQPAGVARDPLDPLCAIDLLADMVKQADDELKRLAAGMGIREGAPRGDAMNSSPRAVTKAPTVESQITDGEQLVCRAHSFVISPEQSAGLSFAKTGVPMAAALLPCKRAREGSAAEQPAVACSTGDESLNNQRRARGHMQLVGLQSPECSPPWEGVDRLYDPGQTDGQGEGVGGCIGRGQADEQMGRAPNIRQAAAAAGVQDGRGELEMRTDAAMHMWRQLTSNVSTPSTFEREKLVLPLDSAKGSNLS